MSEFELMNRETIFSDDRVYRYVLWREWSAPTPDAFYTADPHLAYFPGQHHQYAMFIGLNPSTADETKDDPTIRKCIGFAKRWGYGALCMTNLFAFRATQPKDMKRNVAPVGEDNFNHLAKAAALAGVVIAAWGVNGAHIGQDMNVRSAIAALRIKLMCLRKTKDGHPEHPLYIPYETQPIEL